jgi:hypothetical protein
MHKSWRWFFIGRLAVLLAFTPEVRAAEATAPSLRAEPADTKRALLAPRVSSAPEPVDATAIRWYGYQTLIADASTVALLASAENLNNGSLAYAGLASYLLASPIIHGLHHQPSTAAGSFLLRLGLPVLLGAVGMGLAGSDCHTDDCGLNEAAGAAIGIVAGAMGASVIDMAFLAREPLRRPGGVSVAFLPTQQGATLAMGGRF